jgi:acyl carrier protein
MSHEARAKIDGVVLAKIEEILARPRGEFSMSDHLTNDLEMDSDDISFWFIPDVEAELGVKVPRAEWRKAGTIEEVCRLLERYHRQS